MLRHVSPVHQPKTFKDSEMAQLGKKEIYHYWQFYPISLVFVLLNSVKFYIFQKSFQKVSGKLSTPSGGGVLVIRVLSKDQ